MPSRDNRKKASDVFRETEFVFSKKVSFEEAYPEIKEISIEVIESDGPLEPDFENPPHYPNRKMKYGKDVGEYIDCHNTVCFNGGFSVGSIIQEMVGQKQTYKQDSTFCRGYEGSPKGKKRYQSCLHMLHYRIRIQYNDSQPARSGSS